MKRSTLGLLLIFLSGGRVSHAEPACVTPAAKNYVLAWSISNLADGWEAQWLLQNVETRDRIFLRHCSARAEDSGCYYAVNVVPGKYYFQEVMPDALNSAAYPVTKKAFWFEISGKGVDYIGDWSIERTIDRVIKRLEISYRLKTLDHLVELCNLTQRKLFLSKTLAPAREIVN